MKIFFIGDVMGEPGRLVVKKHLSSLIPERGIDLVVLNGENAAGGFGITPRIVKEFFEWGVDAITMGNHIWDVKEIEEFICKEKRLIRPSNYPEGVPGEGKVIIEARNSVRVGVLQVMGQVFMPPLDCPFRTAKREVEKLRSETPVILVDIHGEATSEKQAMGWFLDGEVSAVVGTHTHVQTADEKILTKGTAYITDVGMTGPTDSIIGIQKDVALKKFLTHMPHRFKVASGPALLCGVMIEVDERTGRGLAIERVQLSDTV
ncbi:MAG TPA: TIGR00282 family metallophosphoesterase [Nitrospiria bacterium]|jgi:hypothetical protein